MKHLIAILIVAFASSAQASYRGELCYATYRNQDVLTEMIARMAVLPAPTFDKQTQFSCHMIRGFACAGPAQDELPVVIKPGADGEAMVDLTTGFPILFRQAHLFYEHERLAMTADGRLMNIRSGETTGYARTEDGRVYAVLTHVEEQPSELTELVVGKREPVRVPFAIDPRLTVSRAYICVPSFR